VSEEESGLRKEIIIYGNVSLFILKNKGYSALCFVKDVYSDIVLMQHGKDGGRISRHQVFLVAAADSSEGLPPAIRRCFSHEISMGPLTEEQRVDMLSQSLQSVSELLPNVSDHFFSFMWFMVNSFCRLMMHLMLNRSC
jgi:SpoVK/Ycf46/Vps4 family AAA+-type ATPase